MRRPGAHKVREPRGASPRVPRSILIVHASEVLTLRGSASPRTREAASDVGLVEDGGLFIVGDRIADVGPSRDLLERHPRADRTIDATGQVVLPGFVDPHTHAIFAGSREHELEWKAEGLDYSEIAARGGGILHTVRATREADEASLAATGAERLARMGSLGTTTAEVKSGYGLRLEDERKILRAAARAGVLAGVEVVPTFLGAHAVPPEFDGRPDEYVDLLVREFLPSVARERLAVFADVFLETGYFSAEQARRILEAAREAGLRPKVHADELSDGGGAALAADVGAISADHLLHTSDAGIEALARAGVIGVLLPATSLTSRMGFADGRRLIAAGVPVALGTDFNPNCWCESMSLAIALACHYNGLTPAQGIVAATINAAHAIGRAEDIGSLEPGKFADVLVADVPSYRHIGYRLGGAVVARIVRRGQVLDAR